MIDSTTRFKFVEHCRAGGHTHVKVYAGTTPGSLGQLGGLVMRNEEWAALRGIMALAADFGALIEIEVAR